MQTRCLSLLIVMVPRCLLVLVLVLPQVRRICD
jgi:hypothetical protein